MVLLPVGFAVPACYQARGALLPHHFTLATHSEEPFGGIFLLHFPSARAAQALPGTVPCGARTFLGTLASDATVWPTPPEALSHARGGRSRMMVYGQMRTQASMKPKPCPIHSSFSDQLILVLVSCMLGHADLIQHVTGYNGFKCQGSRVSLT